VTERRFPCRHDSVGRARLFVRELLADTERETRENVELMVSELATNSIRHAHSAFDVRVSQRDGTIRVEVLDCGGGSPILRSPTPLEPSGRGLLVVATLSNAWGIDPGPNGKMVWFTIPADPDRSGRSRNAA
jgi:anti-sigma regulatory factor (Ser/Thr protein kinase)